MKDEFWKGFAKGLGMVAATVAVVTVVTVATGGTGTALAAAVTTKLLH